VVTQAFGFLVSMMVARILGVKSYGLLAFAYSVAVLCVVVPGFGFNRLTVRELARRPSRASRFMVTVSVLMWLFTLPMAGICALVALFDQNQNGESRLFVILMVFLFMATQQHMLWICSFFRAFQKAGKETFVRILLATLWLFTGIVVLSTGFGLKILVTSRLAATILCLGLTIFLVKKDFKIVIEKFRWRYAKMLVKMSAPLAIFYILAIASPLLNLVILGILRGDVDTGYYSAAEKIVSLIGVIPVSLAWAALPYLSREWVNSQEEFSKTYRKIIRYALLISIPLMVATYFFGGKTISLLFGKEYILSVPVLSILAFGIVPFFVSQINGTALISMNKQNVAVLSVLSGMVVVILTSIVLIPMWGPVGTAFSRLVSLYVILLVEMKVLFRNWWNRGLISTLIKSLAAGSAMAMAAFLLTRYSSALPVLIGLSLAIYTAVLLLIREISLHELVNLRRVCFDICRSYGKR